MQIYGSVSRGQKAVKIKGAGFEFIMYSNTGIKNKTPQASGAGEARTKTYTTHCRPLCEMVKQKINILA